MSRTVATYPIVAAIKKTEDFLGSNRVWATTNPTQSRFLWEFYSKGQNEVGSIGEIESMASRRAEEINSFLAQRGFSIALEPFKRPEDFGTASVLDVLVEWLAEGTVTTVLTPDQKSFPAVRTTKDGVRFYTSNHRYPIAELLTKSGKKVLMSMTDSVPEDDFDLVRLVKELSVNKLSCYEFGGLVFPMVSLDQQFKLDWLLGMNTVDEKEYVGYTAVINQALQQNKLRMNEKGARAQSAVAIGVMRMTSAVERKPDHIINKPFLVWFEQDGLRDPLFVGYITTEDWKNPGGLD